MKRHINLTTTEALASAMTIVMVLFSCSTSQAATLTSNSYSSLPVVGALDNKIRGQITIIDQAYADGSSKNYLLADVSVPIPNVSLGITSALGAPQVKLIASVSRSGSPYVECTLEPRTIGLKSASYTLGLKSIGSGALVRWGVCDNPNVAGYDSLFPVFQSGDVVTLKTITGQQIGVYTVPAAPANTSPATAVKNYAVVNTLENSAYKVAAQ